MRYFKTTSLVVAFVAALTGPLSASLPTSFGPRATPAAVEHSAGAGLAIASAQPASPNVLRAPTVEQNSNNEEEVPSWAVCAACILAAVGIAFAGPAEFLVWCVSNATLCSMIALTCFIQCNNWLFS